MAMTPSTTAPRPKGTAMARRMAAPVASAMTR
jgi:hypothetical protein